MAGRPKRRALIAELTKRAADECEDSEAHLEYVATWIEEGKTLLSLADEITKDAGTEISARQITKYLTERYGDAAELRIARARRIGAHGMADQSIKILDAAPADKDAVAKARARAQGRQWLAERMNRDEFGSSPKVAVQLSIGGLHLDALRQRRATATLAETSESGSDVNAPARAFLKPAEVAEDADFAIVPAIESEGEDSK